MRKLFLILAPILLCTTLQAQYGLSVKYQSVSSQYWEDLFQKSEGDYDTKLIGGSVFYWFRLKEKRVEFLPELGYYGSTGKSSKALSTDQKRITFQFSTDIYLFDIINDCDCPTFSKQGTRFQRSFFIEISPGLDYQFLSLDDATGLNREYDESELTFRFGLGVGFDFGISDLFTLTPIVSMNYGSRPDWEGLIEVLDATPPASNQKSEWIATVGLRATFRPDYKRRYR